MGYRIVREMRKRKLRWNEMAVWTALGDHADDDTCTSAFPSQETLARETGYTDRQVRNILRKLEQRGAIVEARRPGRRTTREYRIVLHAVPLDLRAFTPESGPEKFSGLATAGTGSAEIKTGNLCNQDQKSMHQDRKTSTVKTGKVFRQTLIESSKNPKKEPSDARARETRDVGEASEPARETTPKPSPSDTDERLTPEERERQRIERQEANRVKARRDYAAILEREERERKQARVIVGNGMSQVHAPPDKYAEGNR